MLTDVIIKKSSKEEPSSESKGSTAGFKFRRVKKLKVLSHQAVREDLFVTKSEDPYVIEVEPKGKKKKPPKPKFKTIKELEKEKEKEKIGAFDPRAHILGVFGQKTSQGSSMDKKFQDCSRPLLLQHRW